MITRIVMDINDGAGGGSAFNDTGPGLVGELVQMRWDPVQADTGADLALEQMLTGAADTGDMYRFYNDNDVLGTSFTKCVRQSTHDVSGDPYDTGGDFREPIFFAGEKVRARITPGDTGHIEGNLYLWVRNEH